jgi:1-acyl-sn-glycerol-3-phosphate acyltransferase
VDQHVSALPKTPGVLPQWILDIIRPIIHVVSFLFFNVKHIGSDQIPTSGGLIIAANHQTYFDPFWISLPVKRPTRYLAWNAAFSWPVVGKMITLFGAWPLQLEGSDPAPIRRSLQWLRAGGVIVIFPEGGRGKPDGSMLKFKAGAIRIALEAGVPILPVTIRGGNKVWPSSHRVPRLGNVEIVYHPLYYVTQEPDEETRVCARRETDRLARIIGSGL